ncbi:MAG TPA: hypothetical protein VLJ16_01820 [Acidobacteriota bacterium]|nr:hypothetical protein [Acidobacteriota bacterium]
MHPNLLSQLQQIGTGASFIVFPLVFVFAFAAHPHLLRPRLLKPEAIMLRARGRKRLHLGHALVLLDTALLVVAAFHFMKILSGGRGEWAGFIGAILAVLGAIILAADKGTLCLTMSAMDTLPDDEFSAMTPGLRAMFAKKGWMKLLWGLPLLPAGFAIQAVGLLQAHALPSGETVLFMIGVLFVGTPDGLEIVNLGASLLMALGMVPYGIRLVAAAF